MTNETMSQDGSEVFAWADKLSERMHRSAELLELKRQIRRMENECGNCSKWMTPSCPRESHSNKTGRSTGPSSRAVKCNEFAVSTLSAGAIARAKAKLTDMEGSNK